MPPSFCFNFHPIIPASLSVAFTLFYERGPKLISGWMFAREDWLVVIHFLPTTTPTVETTLHVERVGTFPLLSFRFDLCCISQILLLCFTNALFPHEWTVSSQLILNMLILICWCIWFFYLLHTTIISFNVNTCLNYLNFSIISFVISAVYDYYKAVWDWISQAILTVLNSHCETGSRRTISNTNKLK